MSVFLAGQRASSSSFLEFSMFTRSLAQCKCSSRDTTTTATVCSFSERRQRRRAALTCGQEEIHQVALALPSRPPLPSASPSPASTTRDGGRKASLIGLSSSSLPLAMSMRCRPMAGVCLSDRYDDGNKMARLDGANLSDLRAPVNYGPCGAATRGV